MANRRSLQAAMNLSPEKMAFIQGTPKETAQKPTVEEQPLEITDSPTTPSQDSPPATEPSRHSTPRRSRARRHPRHDFSADEREDLFPGITNLLSPLTTRLQPTTFAALRRAGLEQKLRGRQPATVQEIAEDAIQAWLKEFGYLE